MRSNENQPNLTLIALFGLVVVLGIVAIVYRRSFDAEVTTGGAKMSVPAASPDAGLSVKAH